jgi:hypothetical protein
MEYKLMMRKNVMLTLSDINVATNSKDGDVFSDLHKDVYGFRPRGVIFDSVEDFDAEYERLVGRLTEQLDEETVRQERNFAEFVVRVEGIMALVKNCFDNAAAVAIIAEAEGINDEEMRFYGWESLEYRLDLKFGSIKKWLEE